MEIESHARPEMAPCHENPNCFPSNTQIPHIKSKLNDILIESLSVYSVSGIGGNEFKGDDKVTKSAISIQRNFIWRKPRIFSG